MFGRRVASGLLRHPTNTRLPIRTTFVARPNSSAASLFSQRHYATPSRPKKAVGDPSRPVKRAVKRAARTPSTEGEAAKRLAAEKTTTKKTSTPTGTAKAKEKKKAADAKARERRKLAAAKAKEKKRLDAIKAREKKKAAAAKAKSKTKKPKAPLTELQQAAAKSRKDKAEIASLKKSALSPPPHYGLNAYNAFLIEKGKGGGVGGQDLLNKLSAEWKNLTPAQLEHYNHEAKVQSEARRAEYKRWVESHSVEEVAAANRARASLRRKIPPTKNTSRWARITDERHVKGPKSAYVQFAIDRHASGDFRSIGLPDRAKLIAKEWKSLTGEEKKKYVDLQQQDISRYTDEFKSVFGHIPPSQLNGTQPTGASASL